MNANDLPEKQKLTDAVYNLVCGAGPIIDNEMALSALVDVLAVLVAGGTQQKPASNVDLVAKAIGETIAEKAHHLLRHDPIEEVTIQ
jgi:hypothetical protein